MPESKSSNFAQSSHGSLQAIEQLFVGPIATCAMAVLFAFFAANLCNEIIPVWMSATAIGLVWGALFVMGLALGAIESYRLPVAIWTLMWLALGTHSVTQLTDLSYEVSRCLCVVQLLGGWGSGLLTKRFADQNRTQYSIWDIAVLVSFSAIICWSFQQCGELPEILIQVVPAALGGIVFGLLAVEWGLRDRWTWTRSVALPLGFLGTIVLLRQVAPAMSGTTELFFWMLASPGALVAAQGTLVLAMIGAGRLDLSMVPPVQEPQGFRVVGLDDAPLP